MDLRGRNLSECCQAQPLALLIYAPAPGLNHIAGNAPWDLLRTSFFAQDAIPEDYRPLTGNYILLEGQPGVALLAHLRLGSVQVQAGQFVREGESVAAVGNSGNSTTPHLHFQLIDGRDPFKAEGLLCKFRRYERFRDGMWEGVFDSIPSALEPIRLI